MPSKKAVGPKKKAYKNRVLNAKQRKFAEEWVKLGNADQAATKIGYSLLTVHDLLNNTRIIAYAEELKQRALLSATKRVIITQEVLEENLLNIIEKGGGHERRGEADRHAAIVTGFKVLQHPAFMPAKQVNGTNVQVNTAVGPQPLYRAARVEQLRGDNAKQLEAGDASAV